MRLLVWISRILLGAVFIFSGFVKAIDPLGSAYKFQDYFLAFGVEWLYPAALPLAVLLSTLEFLIGASVILGIRLREAAWGGLLFMVFFTPLTLYIALANPVPDCGCFGDAIIISNWDTFYKNIFILAAAIVIFLYRERIKPLISKKGDLVLALGISVFIIGVSVYCLRNLPVIDFRPWKVGADVGELVMPTPEEAEVFLVFEHNETGETREYPTNDYPWNDEEWAATWDFAEQRRVVIEPYQEAAIEAFYIEDEFGEDLTHYYMTMPEPLLLVVAHDLYKTNQRAFKRRITPLAAKAEDNGWQLIVLTGSTLHAVDEFRHNLQTPYPFYLSDEIELKTMVRSNPGLLLLQEGKILGKWAHRNIPSFEELEQLLQ